MQFVGSASLRIVVSGHIYFYLSHLAEAVRLMANLRRVGINVLPLKGNLVDIIWDDRPKEHYGMVKHSLI